MDGGTLQIGIGSLGDAVVQGADPAPPPQRGFSHDDRGGSTRTSRTPPELRQEAPFETGLHGLSEMFVEGFLDLMRAGILKREVDGTLL